MPQIRFETSAADGWQTEVWAIHRWGDGAPESAERREIVDFHGGAWKWRVPIQTQRIDSMRNVLKVEKKTSPANLQNFLLI